MLPQRRTTRDIFKEMVETDESATKNNEIRKVNMGQFNLLSAKGGGPFQILRSI